MTSLSVNKWYILVSLVIYNYIVLMLFKKREGTKALHLVLTCLCGSFIIYEHDFDLNKSTRLHTAVYTLDLIFDFLGDI